MLRQQVENPEAYAVLLSRTDGALLRVTNTERDVGFRVERIRIILSERHPWSACARGLILRGRNIWHEDADGEHHT